MKRFRSTAGASSVSGVVRVGHDPRTLARRLRKGDIAIIDRADLDAASAAMLADRSPACVINASPSLTGRFQARGAGHLVSKSITLVDVNDRGVLAATDGEKVTIDLAASDGGVTVAIGGATFEGVVIDADFVRDRLADAVPGAGLRIPHLAASALDLIHRDGPALVEGRSVPQLEVDLSNRDALVVTAGPGYRVQLKALKHAMSDLNLVVIVTGDAADAVAEQTRIDVIVGPLDGVSDEVLAKAAEVVVHGEPIAVAATRLGSLAVRHVASDSRLSSEDLAVAIAASGGARMIATVGIESSLADLIDSHRGASSVLARLAAGPAWIDGRMLARLHRSPWSKLQRWLLVVIAALSLVAALSLHPVVRDAVERLLGGS